MYIIQIQIAMKANQLLLHVRTYNIICKTFGLFIDPPQWQCTNTDRAVSIWSWHITDKYVTATLEKFYKSHYGTFVMINDYNLY
jgi:hypothetical protein